MQKRLLERAKTSGRIDDNIESIKKRFQTYLDDTQPILKIFENKNKIKKINSDNLTIDEIFLLVKKIFD